MALKPTLKTEANRAGDSIPYTNTTGSLIAGGTPIQIAGRVGIAPCDIPILGVESLDIRGNFRGQLAAVSVTAGDDIGWDANGSPYGGTALSGCYTNDGGDMDFRVGTASADATNTSGVVEFQLNEFTTDDVDNWDQAANVAAHGAATAAAPAGETQATLTLTSMSGTANTSPAAETNLDTLTITALQQTADNTLAEITFNETWSQGQADTVDKNFKELADQVVSQKALNTVLINNCKSFATELNAAKADNVAVRAEVAKLVTDVGTIITKLNAEIAALKAGGIQATS